MSCHIGEMQDERVRATVRKEARIQQGARLFETEDERLFWFLPESAKNWWRSQYDKDDWTGGKLYLTRRGNFVLREYSYWNVDFFNPPHVTYSVLSIPDALEWLRENGFRSDLHDLDLDDDPVYPGEYEV